MKTSLQRWICNADTGALGQATFVRDDLLPLVGAGLDYEDWRDLANIIGEHRSKSVRLPVYEIARNDLRLVMRNNFDNWKLSVDSSRPIGGGNGLLASLFHTVPPVEPEYTGDELHRVYFDGFPDDDVFGYWSQDPRRWSACIATDCRLWTTIFHVMLELGAVQPLRWRTRESHAAEILERHLRREAAK